ncbi:hypothetical protein R1sor_014611 [Riccia sorocarpa]|uniref:DNA methyltransferase 2 n=1 Tax=Riccia sorocarpa TaxID=122646 RepID=A0ABD3HCV6_9MARC
MAMEDDTGTRTMRVLEFYCGVGGLRYSLEESGVNAVVVDAFDINAVGNDVYQHNFGHRPNQANIQALSVKQLDKYKADAWLLSPPCQPYTRQGLQKDADDARAFSFLKMLELLRLMTSPPTHLLVENVVGFENSVTHSRLLAVLQDAGFTTQEFILSPLQFGIPYSRPRYFCLAKRKPLAFLSPEYNGVLLCEPGPLLGRDGSEPSSGLSEGKKKFCWRPEMPEEDEILVSGGDGVLKSKRKEPILDPTVICRPIRDFLEIVPSAPEEAQVGPLGVDETVRVLSQEGSETTRFDSGFTGEKISGESQADCTSVGRNGSGACEEDPFAAYRVPLNVVQRWVDAYDVVTPESKRCCCFTKSYTRFAKGTGSFLATEVTTRGESEISFAEHIANLRSEGQSLAQLGLRYFTPREVANFHSFPRSFAFPVHVRLKQRYALLGNSLSVAVVSSLLKYLFATSAKPASIMPSSS